MKDSKKQAVTINVRAETGTVLSLNQLLDIEASGAPIRVWTGECQYIGKVITGYVTCLPSAYPDPEEDAGTLEFHLFHVCRKSEPATLYFVDRGDRFGSHNYSEALQREDLCNEIRDIAIYEDNFVTRLINKIKELDSDMRKLEQFINNEALFSEVSKNQQHLLPRQYECMHYEMDILIKRFNDLSNDDKYADIFANAIG